MARLLEDPVRSEPVNAPAQAAALRARFRAAGLRTQKRLGQHFLADLNLARKLVERLEPPAGGPFLEIGPGLGALTFVLVDAGFDGLAVEVDELLAGWLSEALEPWPSVGVLHADFLELEPHVLDRFDRPARVIGNLPYYATSAIVLKLLAWRDRIGDAVLTMQREVAQRLGAAPGSRTYGSLSVALQLRADIEPLVQLPRQAFWPAPEVDSAAIHVRWKTPSAAVAAVDPAFLERVARTGFQQRRKVLAKTLAQGLGVARDAVEAALATADVGVQARAEDVAPEQFALIALRLRESIAAVAERTEPTPGTQEKHR